MENIKKILKYKNEVILGAAAVLILGGLIWISLWELDFLGANIAKSINSGSGKGEGMNFDLEGAKQLNLKGLAQ